MEKPEFTLEQCRDFVAKNFQSVSARYAKSLLLHYDNLSCTELYFTELYSIIQFIERRIETLKYDLSFAKRMNEDKNNMYSEEYFEDTIVAIKSYETDKAMYVEILDNKILALSESFRKK